MTSYDPWRCMYCKKISKASANGCSTCLIPWQECQDTNFVPPSRQEQQDWEGWKYHQDSGKSPRHYKGKREKSQTPKSPRHGGKSHGRGKGKGYQGEYKTGKGSKEKNKTPEKGKGAGLGPAAETMVPPEPPWTPTLHQSNAPLPPPAGPPPLSEDAKTLKELMQALKKSPKEMDPEVQAIMQRFNLKEGQQAGRTLYSAVDELTAARESLDVAKLARHNLHIKWRNFLSDAVQRWQKHTEDSQKEEADLTQQIETARVALSTAIKTFEESKTELGEKVVDVETHAAMAEATEPKDSVGAALHDSIVTMRTQLETLQASADAMVTDEVNSNKRQRLDDGHGASTPSLQGGLPSTSAPAMQPFPQRDKSFQLPDK